MTADVSGRVRLAFRIIAGALLAVHVMLAWRQLKAAAIQTIAPVDDPFFPALLRHPALMLIGFFAPMICESIALRHPTRQRMKVAAVVELIGAALLLVHQATYQYATWVIVFWIAVYLVWLSWSAATDEVHAIAVGPFLAQLLIGFVFLGGAVGKWTAGYWWGDTFSEVFLWRRPYAMLAQSLLGMDPAQTRLAALWLGRSVVVAESALGLLLFLPARAAAVAAVTAAIALWMSSFDLFEVSWPIIGLAAAGWVLARPDNVAARRQRLAESAPMRRM